MKKYQYGDKVWYLDLSTEIPMIKQDKVLEGGIFCRLENYKEIPSGILSTKLYPTKEALLESLDPPSHNFFVGQTVWYIEEADDPTTLRVDKATVHSITNEDVMISVLGIAKFHIGLDLLFASPQDAVTKALELKQW